MDKLSRKATKCSINSFYIISFHSISSKKRVWDIFINISLLKCTNFQYIIIRAILLYYASQVHKVYTHTCTCITKLTTNQTFTMQCINNVEYTNDVNRHCLSLPICDINIPQYLETCWERCESRELIIKVNKGAPGRIPLTFYQQPISNWLPGAFLIYR